MVEIQKYAFIRYCIFLKFTGLYVDLTSGKRRFGLQSCQSITLV